MNEILLKDNRNGIPEDAHSFPDHDLRKVVHHAWLYSDDGWQHDYPCRVNKSEYIARLVCFFVYQEHHKQFCNYGNAGIFLSLTAVEIIVNILISNGGTGNLGVVHFPRQASGKK